MKIRLTLWVLIVGLVGCQQETTSSDNDFLLLEPEKILEYDFRAMMNNYMLYSVEVTLDAGPDGIFDRALYLSKPDLGGAQVASIEVVGLVDTYTYLTMEKVVEIYEDKVLKLGEASSVPIPNNLLGMISDEGTVKLEEFIFLKDTMVVTCAVLEVVTDRPETFPNRFEFECLYTLE